MDKSIGFILPLDNNYCFIPKTITIQHIDYINNDISNVNINNNDEGSLDYMGYCDDQLCEVIKKTGNKKKREQLINNLKKIISLNSRMYKAAQTGGAPKPIHKVSKLLNKIGNVDAAGRIRRVIFLIVHNSKPYYMKCSPLEKRFKRIFSKCEEAKRKALEEKKSPNEIRQARLQPLNDLPFEAGLLGPYLYEARMYDVVNKELNHIGKNDSVVQLIDYGIIDINNAFVVDIDNEEVILSNINVTEESLGACSTESPELLIEKKITKILTRKLGEEPSPGLLAEHKAKYLEKYNSKISDELKKYFRYGTYYSYLITECTSEYITFHDFLKKKKNYEEVVFKEKINMYLRNTLNLLNDLRGTIQFSHNDLHPGNLLIKEQDDSIKLFDFDLSTCVYNYRNTINDLNDMFNDWHYTLKKICSQMKIKQPKIKEALYTYDIYRICVEFFIYSFYYTQSLVDFDDIEDNNIFPDIKFFTGYGEELPLKYIVDNFFKAPEFDNLITALNDGCCLDEELGELLDIPMIESDPFCMKVVFAWFLFGNHYENLDLESRPRRVMKESDKPHISPLSDSLPLSKPTMVKSSTKNDEGLSTLEKQEVDDNWVYVDLSGSIDEMVNTSNKSWFTLGGGGLYDRNHRSLFKTKSINIRGGTKRALRKSKKKIHKYITIKTKTKLKNK